jgi:ABC-2 type transport system ATP-binding protein
LSQLPIQIADQLNDSTGQVQSSRPTVVEVRAVAKSFRLPTQRIDTLKERALHPIHRVGFRELRVLRDINFDVQRGEFFGIVGRNGSGKSTLLKILASIYRADAGRVRMAGRVAPFIELGVGFNPELTARENGVLNGVLMGLTMREARRRLDSVLDFGELREFVDLKLKNYSSGMMVRLAFAIMVQADADIMLIDEVLAVGDAAFAQKCMDTFHAKRRAGKTIVLVTHDMNTVQSLCDRAMLIHDGELVYVGAPDETAVRYLRLNFATSGGRSEVPLEREAVHELHVRVLESAVLDASGHAVEGVEQGEPIRVRLAFEAVRELGGPIFQFNVTAAQGTVVGSFTRTVTEPVASGRTIRFDGSLENPLVPGRYYLDCWIRQDETDDVMGIQARRLLSFVVFGLGQRQGLVTLSGDLEPSVEDQP